MSSRAGTGNVLFRKALGKAGAIARGGVPIAKRATRRPGQILHRDAWQIVAKPEEATPTLWW